jgi:hypothetical protein
MVKVTLDFEVREGFTMSPDGSSWSVIKGLSRAKITQLKKKQFFPDVIIAKYDLELAAGVAKFVRNTCWNSPIIACAIAVLPR